MFDKTELLCVPVSISWASRYKSCSWPLLKNSVCFENLLLNESSTLKSWALALLWPLDKEQTYFFHTKKPRHWMLVWMTTKTEICSWHLYRHVQLNANMVTVMCNVIQWNVWSCESLFRRCDSEQTLQGCDRCDGVRQRWEKEMVSRCAWAHILFTFERLCVHNI